MGTRLRRAGCRLGAGCFFGSGLGIVGTNSIVTLGVQLLRDHPGIQPVPTLVGVSADATEEQLLQETRRLSREAGALLRVRTPPVEDHIAALVEATAGFIGPGYGVETNESRAARRISIATPQVKLIPL